MDENRTTNLLSIYISWDLFFIFYLFFFWERYKLEIWWYKFENKYTYLFYILFLFEHDGSPQIMLNECLYGLPWLQRKSNCHSKENRTVILTTPLIKKEVDSTSRLQKTEIERERERASLRFTQRSFPSLNSLFLFSK